MPLQDLRDGPRTGDAPVPDKKVCDAMFNHFLKANTDDSKAKMTPDEQEKFRSAFGDEKFRAILADYMEEISDPKHRAEQEAYITQLEGDDKVPQGKELVRPDACFVVKTYVTTPGGEAGGGSSTKGEKIFVNIVQSDKIEKPTSRPAEGGRHWSLPLSLGPKRLEADKSGGALVQTFDACFHPEAMALAKADKQFKDYLVHTALDHAEQALNKLKPRPRPGNPPPALDKVNRDYHVLRGIYYKNGKPAIMMMAKDSVEDVSDAARRAAEAAAAAGRDFDRTNSAAAIDVLTPPGSAGKPAAPAVSKGFLNGGTKANQAKAAAVAPAPASGMMQAVSTTVKRAGAGEVGGAVEPTFRVSERGHFDLANHLTSRVAQPTRPKELVVVLELPALQQPKPAMDLDVSDHRLVFTANRRAAAAAPGAGGNGAATYRLELPLPYPCIGAKGTAKFDKGRSELKVTIPVRPPKAVKEADIVSGVAAAAVQEIHPTAVEAVSATGGAGEALGRGSGAEEGEEEEEEEEEVLLSEAMEKAALGKSYGTSKAAAAARREAEARAADAKHKAKLEAEEAGGAGVAGGVSGSGGLLDHEAAAKLRTGRMAFNLPEGASLVQKPRHATMQPPVVSPPMPPASPAGAGAALASSLPAPTFKARGAFAASAAFQGRCPGYAFKTGVAGVGYYRDVLQPEATETSSEEEEEEEGEAVEAEEEEEGEAVEVAPFEVRQMEAVVTVLVQLPGIDAKRSKVTFAAGGGGGGGGSVAMDLVVCAAGEAAGGGGETAGGTERRAALVLEAGGELDVGRCRFDVADNNMVVILVKEGGGGLWDVPVTDVTRKAKAKKEEKKVAKKKKEKKKKNATRPAVADAKVAAGSEDAAAAEVAEHARLVAHERAVKGSMDALERAAAQRSAASASGVGKITGGAMSTPLPPANVALELAASSSQTAVASGSASSSTPVAPVAFSNSLMFELD